ncbi:uncharacterized protein LY89DRAFT_199443 [Mollisia scopiformis]|uniref:Uncharacterized protein n=1 Tax=Mollisia scopiformis TaxID=149040 RepID=A0A194WYL2_MOLSC|nr:uncharacterized protein LY89DRAFT_199443 [Mollisia scopiformis]KUJ13035.1 hypothetical protein LY89DRAFT_199443 [Mollisia scopiformis]
MYIKTFIDICPSKESMKVKLVIEKSCILKEKGLCRPLELASIYHPCLLINLLCIYFMLLS